MFTSIQDLIPKIAKKKNALQIMQSSSTCTKVQNILDLFFQNPNLKAKVVSFKNSKLKISCKNSTHLHELTMLKTEIFKEIKDKNLNENIKEIFFTLDG